MFSCEHCETFKNTNFKEHLRTAASVASEHLVLKQTKALLTLALFFRIFPFDSPKNIRKPLVETLGRKGLIDCFPYDGNINLYPLSQPAFTCSKLTIETLCEIYSKLRIKIPEGLFWYHYC